MSAVSERSTKQNTPVPPSWTGVLVQGRAALSAASRAFRSSRGSRELLRYEQPMLAPQLWQR